MNAGVDTTGLAAELIRRPSVTPQDEGALDILAASLETFGSPVWSSAATATIGSAISIPAAARAGPICASPGTPTWCRPARSTPGSFDPFRRHCATASCVAGIRST
jgi:hypothetical protein